jgi:hypothetical protein
MNEQNDYTLDELFEKAKDDPSWEPDAQKRKELIDELRAAVARS